MRRVRVHRREPTLIYSGQYRPNKGQLDFLRKLDADALGAGASSSFVTSRICRSICARILRVSLFKQQPIGAVD